MSGERSGKESVARVSDRFTTTHWSVVLSAEPSNRAQAAEAMETLCRTYWYPLYAFVRRRGFNPEDAQDLTQAFLHHLLATHALGGVHPAKGRFRSFLLAAMNNFLANEWHKGQAQKRGGGRTIISLDAGVRFQAEPSEQLSPDRVFEREWAMTVLAEVAAHLREDYVGSGRGPLFAALRVYLGGDRGLPAYREPADRLGLSVDAFKKAVERLRRRYGELLREQIAHTVNNPVEVDDEIRHLRRVFAAP